MMKTKMKQLSCAALALCLSLSLCAPSRAIQVLIPAGTSSTPVSQLLTDSATGQTGQTGLTGAGIGVKVACVGGVAGSVTITVKVPGTTAVVNGQGSVTDEGNGNYAYFPTPAETPQAGSSILYVHFVATGSGPQDASGQIVPALPGIIITNTDKTGYIVAGGTVGSVTGSVGSISGITFPSNFGTFSVDASGRVTLVPGQSTVASNFTAAPTVTQIAAGILAIPANLLATDTTGRVTVGTNADKTGYTATATNLPSDYQQRGVAVTLPTLPAVTVGGYSAGQDPAALLLLTPANKLATSSAGYVTTSNPATGGITEATIWNYANRSLTDKAGFTLAAGEYANIAAAVLGSVIDGAVTVKQAQALNLAYNFGQYTRVKTAGAQTLTFTNRAGQTIATSVSSLDANGNPTGRTSVTFTNLP